MMQIPTDRKQIKLKIGLSLALFLGVAAVFSDVRHFEFIGFDDKGLISENPFIHNGFSRAGIRWAFTADLEYNSDYADFWAPLTFLSHMVAVEIFGMNPSGHHLVNLLFHSVNTLLLFHVFHRMTGLLWPSALVAALFAFHPLRAESVAWVTERKDVLSMMFFMLTLWAYHFYSRSRSRLRYLLVVLAFTLGLMSKPMLMTLPFVLLLLDFWPLKRISLNTLNEPNGIQQALRLIAEKIPLFLLTGVSVLVTYEGVRRAAGVSTFEEYPFGDRVGNAVVSYVSYIRRMFWPTDLAFFYPHPGGALPEWKIIGSGLLLAAVTVSVVRRIKDRPYLAVGWFWYVGMLVPVVGFIQAGDHAMADRYTYIPMIGLNMMMAWSIVDLLSWRPRLATVVSDLVSVVILILMVATWYQVQHWRDDVALSEYALKVTENNFLPHAVLGAAYRDRGDTVSAIEHLQAALLIRPEDTVTRLNLGMTYQQQKRYKDAVSEYQKAIRLNPGHAMTHYNLGLAYQELGEFDKAIKEYELVLSLNPEHFMSNNNLGNIYKTIGRFDDAIDQFQKALAVNPRYADALNNLGAAYSAKGDYDQAILNLQSALELESGHVEAYNNLGNVYWRQGKPDEAIRAYESALKIDPNSILPLYNLALVYQRTGKNGEARMIFERILRIAPDFEPAQTAIRFLPD